MTKTKKKACYFPSGLPDNRLGRGPRPLVIFQGLSFENKPQPGMASWMYRFLGGGLHRVQRTAKAGAASGRYAS